MNPSLFCDCSATFRFAIWAHLHVAEIDSPLWCLVWTVPAGFASVPEGIEVEARGGIVAILSNLACAIWEPACVSGPAGGVCSVGGPR